MAGFRSRHRGADLTQLADADHPSAARAAPDEIALVRSSVLMMGDLEVWCRVTVLGPGGVERCGWALWGLGRPDLAVVDGLARLRLAAVRAGGAIVLRDVSAELADLLDLVGLRRELGGQPEGGKDPLGVEEEMHPGDPPG